MPADCLQSWSDAKGFYKRNTYLTWETGCNESVEEQAVESEVARDAVVEQ